jgi:hypothetical protein
MLRLKLLPRSTTTPRWCRPVVEPSQSTAFIASSWSLKQQMKSEERVLIQLEESSPSRGCSPSFPSPASFSSLRFLTGAMREIGRTATTVNGSAELAQRCVLVCLLSLRRTDHPNSPFLADLLVYVSQQGIFRIRHPLPDRHRLRLNGLCPSSDDHPLSRRAFCFLPSRDFPSPLTQSRPPSVLQL